MKTKDGEETKVRREMENKKKRNGGGEEVEERAQSIMILGVSTRKNQHRFFIKSNP